MLKRDSSPLFRDIIINVLYLTFTVALIYWGGSGLDYFINFYKDNSTLVWISFGISAISLAAAESFFKNGPRFFAPILLIVGILAPLATIKFATNAGVDLDLIVKFILVYFPVNMGGFGLIRTIGEVTGKNN